MAFFTMFLVSLAVSLVSFAVSALLAPKPEVEDARPADLGDFRVPTATEGRVLPIIWGTVLIDGPNVVWYGDLTTEPIKKKVKTGAFSSETVTVAFRYRIGMQFGLCHGTIDGIRRIRYNKTQDLYNGALTKADIVFDDKLLFGGTEDPGANGGLAMRFEIQDGSQTTVQPYLSAVLGATILPAYKGTAHVVMKHETDSVNEGAYIGNSPNLREFDFEVSRFPDNLGLLGSNHIVNGQDSNPAEVIYEILTDTDWGLGLSPLQIDTANFNSIGETLFTEGNGVSMTVTTGRQAVEIIREIERQIDGKLYVDVATGLFKIQLARNDYDINTVPQLDESNVLELKDFSRGEWTKTSNEVRVPFSNASDSYKQTFAMAQDPANFEIQGERKITQVRFPGVKNGTLANQLAIRELRSVSFPLASATAICNRTQYERQPVDVVALTWPERGLVKLPMRVSSVDLGRLDDGKVTLGLVQDIFQNETTTVGDPADSNFVLPVASAGALAAADQAIIELPLLMAKQFQGQGLVNHLLSIAGDAGNQESAFTYERIADISPFSTFDQTYGELEGFARIGTLRAALVGFVNAMPAQGAGTIDLDPLPGQSLDEFFGAISESETEAGFEGIAVIDPGTTDEEWIYFNNIVDSGAGIQLQGVWRGAQDTIPKAHLINARVWLAWTGGMGVVLNEFANSAVVRFKYLPRSINEQVQEASATALADITLPAADGYRLAKPYPPNELSLNGTVRDDTNVDADTSHTGGTGILLEWTRRDFNNDSPIRNVMGQDDDGNTDWSNLEGGNADLRWNLWFYDLDDTPNPTGRGDAYFSDTTASGAMISEYLHLRSDMIANTVDNLVPENLRIEIESIHNSPATDNPAREPLFFDCTVVGTPQ